MAVKYLTTIYGTGRPAQYSASYAELTLKEELDLGTLVAVDNDGVSLIKADEDNIPVGVVHEVGVIGVHDSLYLTGERDAMKAGVGTHIPLYKQFLISGLEIEGTLKIGAPVYLTGKKEAAKLTVNKPVTGFVVGTVERVTDKLVRFDLTLAGALKLTTSKID